MKPTIVVLALAATVGMVSAAAANEFRGKFGTRVNPVSNSVYEVVARSSSRGSDFWCGASEYARRVLGRDWRDRVYVARDLGPSVTTNRRSAVHFTTDPAAAGITPIESSIRINRFAVGDNMSIQQANTYCHARRGRF